MVDDHDADNEVDATAPELVSDPGIPLPPPAGSGDSSRPGRRHLLTAVLVVLAIVLVAAAFARTRTDESSSSDAFVPVLPDPECYGSLQDTLDSWAAREALPVPDSLPGLTNTVGGTEAPTSAEPAADRATTADAFAVADVIDTVRRSGMAARWDDVGACVISLGSKPGSILIDVVDGTLPADLEAETLALTDDGRLEINHVVWEGVPDLARWELAPDANVDPTSRSLDVLVTERACASGRSPDGRIGPPDITDTDETVTIEITVYGTPGPNKCPGNPPTPFTVELSEPLGDRTLAGMTPDN